jgi:hypothetical protein
MVTKLISRDQKLTLARASKTLGAFAVSTTECPSLTQRGSWIRFEGWGYPPSGVGREACQ